MMGAVVRDRDRLSALPPDEIPLEPQSPDLALLSSNYTGTHHSDSTTQTQLNQESQPDQELTSAMRLTSLRRLRAYLDPGYVSPFLGGICVLEHPPQSAARQAVAV